VLNVRLTKFLCKILLFFEIQRVKIGWQIRQNFLRKAMAQKGCFEGDDDDVRHRLTYPCNRLWKPVGFEQLRLQHFLYKAHRWR
jgi:hypothetical protein